MICHDSSRGAAHSYAIRTHDAEITSRKINSKSCLMEVRVHKIEHNVDVVESFHRGWRQHVSDDTNLPHKNHQQMTPCSQQRTVARSAKAHVFVVAKLHQLDLSQNPLAVHDVIEGSWHLNSEWQHVVSSGPNRLGARHLLYCHLLRCCEVLCTANESICTFPHRFYRLVSRIDLEPSPIHIIHLTTRRISRLWRCNTHAPLSWRSSRFSNAWYAVRRFTLSDSPSLNSFHLV